MLAIKWYIAFAYILTLKKKSICQEMIFVFDIIMIFENLMNTGTLIL